MPSLPTPSNPFVPFAGGLDITVAPILASPGLLREALNVEIDVNGGYITGTGYERFDGRPSPSAALYAIIEVEFSDDVDVGDTITGVTSAATASVIAVTDEYLVITKITGTFQAEEILNVSGSPVGETLSEALLESASTQQLSADYLLLAANKYRSDIGAVPGSGAIRGVFTLGNNVFAVRDNAGASIQEMYKASSSGWVKVELGFELAFTGGGTYEIAVGNTITGATSGATAVVTAVVVQEGDWTTGDAAGRIIFATKTGNFAAENLDVGANTNVATIAANATAITMLPGGRVRTIKYNFYGGASTRRVYGCDSVNRGFEFDGTVFVPIVTGMAIDRPNHVVAHSSHLFFAFGSSLQHSSPGSPHDWDPVTGADEIGVGDTITGLKSELGSSTGGSLTVFSRNTVHVLHGTSADDWIMVKYKDEVGAYADSIQQMTSTVMVDDRGITNLRAADTYGNFADATLSKAIQPYIVARKNRVVASCICRSKNQYRVYFSGKEALYITMSGNKVIGMMPQQLEHQVTCVDSSEDASGNERIFYGADNGFVYEAEKGTSYDGETLDWYFILHFLSFGNARLKKRYLSAAIEAQGQGYCEFNFSFEIGYASPEYHQPNAQAMSARFSSSRWDEFTWDDFYWDGVSISPVYVKLYGRAENISYILRGSSAAYKPIKFSGISTRLLTGRELR
jgi:hypothetical protein